MVAVLQGVWSRDTAIVKYVSILLLSFVQILVRFSFMSGGIEFCKFAHLVEEYCFASLCTELYVAETNKSL